MWCVGGLVARRLGACGNQQQEQDRCPGSYQLSRSSLASPACQQNRGVALVALVALRRLDPVLETETRYLYDGSFGALPIGRAQ